MNLTGHIENPFKIEEIKEWKLKDLLEELKAVNEILETVKSNSLLRNYRAFIIDQICQYTREKMKGTDYEWN